MARKFYKYPPRPSSGAGTFSDNLVGFQLVDGGGLTQGNFEFTTSIVEKVNRNFHIGAFSAPISLDTLNIGSVLESRAIIAKEFRVYPNFDLSEVTRFSLYGSLSKRLSTSIQKIINYFPAAIEVYNINYDMSTGYTAINAVYDNVEDLTTFEVDIDKIRNPFGIDYSVNATRNISLLDYNVTYLRNLTTYYKDYSVYINDVEYPVMFFKPSDSLVTGVLDITVSGNPFSGNAQSVDTLIIRPNDYYSDKALIEPFDEVEKFLLNRLITPQYTAVFQTPRQSEDGTTYIEANSVTWPLDGFWNLDIRTIAFDNYLTTISDIAESFDASRTNLVTRFLTTESFKEFDTEDQKVQKILSIYGRSFDEVKKFIDTLAYMNSVNYNIGNDIPSQLLKNLAETLGWRINVSPITTENFLDSIFGNKSKIEYPGFSRANTPTELNYQFYRNLILNSAYLFKSKGTRRSIEFLLRLVGAPEALVEFNENIYIAGQRINLDEFNEKYIQISGGTYSEELPVYDTNTVFSILGNPYTGFTTESVNTDVDTTIDDYPIDSEGYPMAPTNSENFFFQKGAGWFELVKDHQSPQVVNRATSVFTGQNFNIQTEFEPFTYGQKYLDRFRRFPYMSEGFKLTRTVDNKKSWTVTDVDLRVGGGTSQYNAYYLVNNDKLVLNVKNVDLFLNPAQGLLYDVWHMSNKYNYPIPSTGLTSPYPQPGGVDWTVINPQPTKKTFFEFAQTFWLNMINVRNRQISSDGKTGGYPTLDSIYWKYLTSNQDVNIPNDNYTYKTMIDYVTGMGDYWIRLVEQMIPATTLWLGGNKYENSIFHRQKFVYRLQRGCQIIPVPCEPCSVSGSIFPNSCVDETVSCPVFPWDNGKSTALTFADVLSEALNDYLATQLLTTSDCVTSTLVTDWYIDLRLNGNILIQEKIYTGYGLFPVDVPSNSFWIASLDTYLSGLVNYGFNYYFSNDDKTLYVSNLACDATNQNKLFQLNVGLNFNIVCS